MTDLIERIRAAIDEDERLAERVNHVGHWQLTLHGPNWGIEGERQMVEHVLRHDPVRVLRTAQIYRDLLYGAEHALHEADQDPNDPVRGSDAVIARNTLEDLAEIYGIEVAL